MKVEILTFCDYAVNYGGKLCILGVSEVFEALRFPLTIRGCLAYKLRLDPDHVGPVHLIVQFDDDEGQSISTFTLDVAGPQKFLGLGFQPICGALFVDYLVLPRPGVHSVSLQNGHGMLASIQLIAVQTGGRG